MTEEDGFRELAISFISKLGGETMQSVDWDQERISEAFEHILEYTVQNELQLARQRDALKSLADGLRERMGMLEILLNRARIVCEYEAEFRNSDRCSAMAEEIRGMDR